MPDKIYFYIDPKNITDNKFVLDADESNHLIKVLRKRISTEIWLIDGIGTAYTSVINNIKDNLASGDILKEFPNYGENTCEISLGIGLLKKDKIELVVEKATECGVSKIYPIILDHSIKREINTDRLNKIVFSASKQCGRSRFPIIHEPITLVNLIEKYDNQNIYVYHESGDDLLSVIPNEFPRKSKILLLVGPEGDFSNHEIKTLKDNNVKFVNLGKRRLRSETAAIAAVSQINLYCN